VIALTNSGAMSRTLSYRRHDETAFRSNQSRLAATNGDHLIQSRPQNVSDATIREIPEPEQKKPASHLAVRFLLLVVTTLQMAFVVLATVLIVSGTNQHGDGKEYAAVALAIMLLEIPFTIPAFILAFRGKALGIAACLAGFATFAYVVFWIQLYAEVSTRGA
jgi:hypothetical protein